MIIFDFDKDTIQQVADNLQRPGGRIPDPTSKKLTGATILIPHFFLGEKSQKQLLTACDIVRYYNTTRQGITTLKMLWNTVINNFEAQWKALKELKNETSQMSPRSPRPYQ